MHNTHTKNHVTQAVSLNFRSQSENQQKIDRKSTKNRRTSCKNDDPSVKLALRIRPGSPSTLSERQSWLSQHYKRPKLSQNTRSYGLGTRKRAFQDAPQNSPARRAGGFARGVLRTLDVPYKGNPIVLGVRRMFEIHRIPGRPGGFPGKTCVPRQDVRSPARHAFPGETCGWICPWGFEHFGRPV